MPTELFRLMAVFGPQVIWVFIFIMALLAVFVLYIGVCLWSVLRARDDSQREVRYQMFRDLLDLFRRREHK